MKKNLGMIITVTIILTLSILGLVFSSYSFTTTQQETLIILAIICGASMLYCFIVGELANNNSQMDKLWSVLPIVYTWVIAAKANFNLRTLLFAIIVTLWGIRLTFNFARKGAYSIKFWTGEEDYRWAILRKNKIFSKRPAWIAFNLFFISIYQNLIVLTICLPAVNLMHSTLPFGVCDYLATFFSLYFLGLETIADEEQWVFQTNKKKMLKEHDSLDELESPYNLGFNTRGLWAYFRHPNYLGEQGIWLCLYLFVIGAGVATYGIFNWSMVGPLFLVLLFLGSSTLGEAISSKKYPEYSNYQKQVFKYIPLRKYNPNR